LLSPQRGTCIRITQLYFVIPHNYAHGDVAIYSVIIHGVACDFEIVSYLWSNHALGFPIADRTYSVYNNVAFICSKQ
jgi:hypothetical protein